MDVGIYLRKFFVIYWPTPAPALLYQCHWHQEFLVVLKELFYDMFNVLPESIGTVSIVLPLDLYRTDYRKCHFFPRTIRD